MKKKDKKKYLKILELGENASRDDIENAYSHFVKLYYSDDSPEIHPLREEITKDERKKILSAIDNAYKNLVGEDAVNRMEFSAEIEPQEIILDEDEEAVIEHEEIEPSEEARDDADPVVEFEYSDEPVVEIAGDESIPGIYESKEPVLEIPVEESATSINDNEELLLEIPVEESEANISDSEEPLFENAGSEMGDIEHPAEIEHQVIDVERIDNVEEEDEKTLVKDESAEIEDQGIEFVEDISIEEESKGVSVEEETEEVEDETVEQEEIVEDKAPIGTDVEITGKFMKKQRESRKLKVRDVGELLNISYKDIVNIENEKFDKLNDPGYLRWVIKSYAKLLDIVEDKSAEDYMRRYRQKK